MNFDDIASLIVDEISLKKNIDLYSFHQNYLSRKLEERIVDLKFSDKKEYMEYLYSNPDESDTFYNQYLYHFLDSNLYTHLMPDILDVLKSAIPKDKKSIFKVWIPLASDKDSVIILKCALEDMRIQGEIPGYQIYITHPSREAIVKLRNKTKIRSQEVFLPHWMESYFRENPLGGMESILELRSKTIYAQHDFLCDSPLKSLDLILLNGYFCIYSEFRRTMILRTFYDSLRENGHIVSSEFNVKGEFLTLFTPVDTSTDSSQSPRHFFQKTKGLIKANKEHFHFSHRYNIIYETSLENKIRNSFFETQDIGFILVSDEGHVYEISQNLKNCMNINEGSFNYKIEEIFNPEISEILLRILWDGKKAERPIQRRFRSEDPDLSGRFNQISAQPILPTPSETMRMYSLFLWNSQASTEEESQNNFTRAIREIHHRVKNQMTIIFSLFELERNNSDNPEVDLLISRMSSRIHAIEIIQNQLSENPFQLQVDFKSCIQSYIQYFQSQIFGNNLNLPIHLSSSAFGFLIPSRQASPILLCLSEIFSHLLENLILETNETTEIKLNAQRDSSRLSIEILLQSPGRTNPWKDMDELQNSILSANAHQIQSTWTKEKTEESLRYTLHLNSI